MISYRTVLRKGPKMWVTVLCPKCGVRNEVDPCELCDDAACCQCFEKLPVPYQLQNQNDQYNPEDLVLTGQNDSRFLDSSFWLS